VFTNNENLLPELGSFLEQIEETCPAAATRAGHILAQLCKPWLAHLSNGQSLQNSLLAPGGYPLDFTFRSGLNDINYTAEPGLPGATTNDKWQFVRELTAGFDPVLHPLVQRLVDQPGQRFGCWLGVRHPGRGNATAFKLYQEVTPAAGDEVFESLCADVPGIDNIPDITPTLLGLAAVDSEIIEYYCKVSNADPGVLHSLFSLAGAAKQLPAVINYLVYLAGEQRSTLWGRLSLGVSFQLAIARPPTVTLFTHAPELFPNDRVARTRILGLARQFGGEMPAYDKLTLAFEQNEIPGMAHNMVGIKVTASGKLECAVGLRPFQQAGAENFVH
jgi:hypothetical protein